MTPLPCGRQQASVAALTIRVSDSMGKNEGVLDQYTEISLPPRTSVRIPCDPVTHRPPLLRSYLAFISHTRLSYVLVILSLGHARIIGEIKHSSFVAPASTYGRWLVVDGARTATKNFLATPRGLVWGITRG